MLKGVNRIFISGRITGTDDYMERFGEAEKRIEDAGYVAVNPAFMGCALKDGTRMEYMLLTLKLLEFSDAIYMLSGWEKSLGAREELSRAKMLKMPVIYEEQNLFVEGIK